MFVQAASGMAGLLCDNIAASCITGFTDLYQISMGFQIGNTIFNVEIFCNHLFIIAFQGSPPLPQGKGPPPSLTGEAPPTFPQGKWGGLPQKKLGKGGLP